MYYCYHILKKFQLFRLYFELFILGGGERKTKFSKKQEKFFFEKHKFCFIIFFFKIS